MANRLKLEGINLIHRGEFLNYYELIYRTKSGHIKKYEMVSKQGSTHENTPDLTECTVGKNNRAVILLVFNEDHSKMLISKEFRLGVNNWVYNTVAGLVDEGETVYQAASRELMEETGLKLIRVVDELNPTYTCAPVTDDVTTMIICEATGDVAESDNEFEQIVSAWYTKDDARKLLNNKEAILSGRLQAFVYMWVNGGYNV